MENLNSTLNSFQFSIDGSVKGSANFMIGQNQVTYLERDLNELTNRTNTNSSNIGANSAAIEGVRIEVGKLQTALGEGFSSDNTVKDEIDDIKNTFGEGISSSAGETVAAKIGLVENNINSLENKIVLSEDRITSLGKTGNYSVNIGIDNQGIYDQEGNDDNDRYKVLIGKGLIRSCESIILGQYNYEYQSDKAVYLAIGNGNEEKRRNSLEIIGDFVGLRSFGAINDGLDPQNTNYRYLTVNQSNSDRDENYDLIIEPNESNTCLLGTTSKPFYSIVTNSITVNPIDTTTGSSIFAQDYKLPDDIEGRDKLTGYGLNKQGLTLANQALLKADVRSRSGIHLWNMNTGKSEGITSATSLIPEHSGYNYLGEPDHYWYILYSDEIKTGTLIAKEDNIKVTGSLDIEQINAKQVDVTNSISAYFQITSRDSVQAPEIRTYEGSSSSGAMYTQKMYAEKIFFDENISLFIEVNEDNEAILKLKYGDNSAEIGTCLKHF